MCFLYISGLRYVFWSFFQGNRKKRSHFSKIPIQQTTKIQRRFWGAGISVFLGISTSLFSTEGRWDGHFFNPLVHFKKGGDIALRMWRKIAAL